MGLGNRGKGLERIILGANNYYGIHGLAEVVQMPTPVKVKGVTKAGVVQGHFERSTVDFYGTLKGGRALYFDAKETKKTLFEIANDKVMHTHQLDFLRKQHNLGALCFLVIEFTTAVEAYALPFLVVDEYYKRAMFLPPGAKGKSIPLKDCRERPDIHRINTSGGFLHYLEPALADLE